ncbi:Homeodomain-like protein [Syncephalastrum racemosum]|uniref:Homeodomain-like protein n=1 Tax=Syncephalastrum racemosum TaxID=13706 RepID=A0A1X2HL90_SYNRA|nr:Homeodomain-like protein [Syncephalastrum racemosum]
MDLSTLVHTPTDRLLSPPATPKASMSDMSSSCSVSSGEMLPETPPPHLPSPKGFGTRASRPKVFAFHRERHHALGLSSPLPSFTLPPTTSISPAITTITLHRPSSSLTIKKPTPIRQHTVKKSPSLPPSPTPSVTVNRKRSASNCSASKEVKKSKTDAAAAYDRVDLSVPDHEVFAEGWMPDMGVFDKKPGVRVIWKGSPLNVQNMPYYERLHPGEVTIASTLRLNPEQYLKCKRTLVLAAQAAHCSQSPFRKSDAQKLCRIDVNKVSTLWSVFGRLGWLGPDWPN